MHIHELHIQIRHVLLISYMKDTESTRNITYVQRFKMHAYSIGIFIDELSESYVWNTLQDCTKQHDLVDKMKRMAEHKAIGTPALICRGWHLV